MVVNLSVVNRSGSWRPRGRDRDSGSGNPRPSLPGSRMESVRIVEIAFPFLVNTATSVRSADITTSLIRLI